MKRHLYDFPIKTFNSESLMEEILKANDGDVFVLKEENISPNIGEYWPELTTIQVKKVKENKTHYQAQMKSPDNTTKSGKF